MRNLVRAKGQLDRNVELQFIELIEHLTALVGSSSIVQSNWFRAKNLDLGETPLAVMSTPDGIEHLRDYPEGQLCRS